MLHGLISALEYVSIPAVAIFLSASCQQHSHWDDTRRLVAMRVLVGISLSVLALTEKLLQPQMAMELLTQYPLNFMKALGIDYSDRLFILSAGAVELVFGLCLIFGLATRITVVALATFLVASNVYFFAIGDVDSALLEAGGHAPLFAAALPLLLLGRGQLSLRRGVCWQASVPKLGESTGLRRRTQRSFIGSTAASTPRSTSMRNP